MRDESGSLPLSLVPGGYAPEDPCWAVDYFVGKTKRITFHKFQAEIGVEMPEITAISVKTAPTMTFLNPRPAASSPGYPWRWDGGEHNHFIKLPVPLTYNELKEGSQIVATGITEKPEVIEGTLDPNGLIEYRAGGLLIAQAVGYQGEKDLVQLIIMENFTGMVLAVNFDKAYKNLPAIDSLQNESGDGTYQYCDEEFNKIARCVLNSYCLGKNPILCQPKVSAGDVNRIYESIYVANVGEAIETSIVYGGRDLYVIQVGMGWKLKVIRPIVNDGWLITYPEI